MLTHLQSQAAECGLACLAMVADHHGQRIGLRELRQRFPLSLKGASLNRLIGIAHQLGFQTRVLRLELDELPQLRLPCILHWDLNHFVVLARVGRKTITILDPGFGERKLGLDELSRHFTGIALELTPGKVEHISRSALSAGELASLLGGAQPDELYYRIVVSLESQAVRAFGKDEPLKPGLLLEAQILGERRKLWEWAVEPLFALEGSVNAP